ncbi:NADH-ubiquinone oxidoreductase-F iron-sulfur binding region domain-containing protein [Nocardioides cheoyonin]|uniref:NADH-ubiquinone oxidoreductase-F iron-sulfur binding region domain-containing protein n=1 Tax=Nocardioides cheoyonin TaxID=3156615 RepID=UPI0032B579D3
MDTTRVQAWPGIVGGVLADDPDRFEDFETYRGRGGYDALSSPDLICQRLSANPSVHALHGRGGASYPYWRKVVAARAAGIEQRLAPVVAANGAEGEPLSVKDRYLMRHRPHLVLDGLALSAAAVGAEHAYVYVADELSRRAMEKAIYEASGLLGCNVKIAIAQDTYVAGESSALVRSVQTGTARPVDGPPRPHHVGIGSVPTVVSNVETLARVARSLQPAPAADDEVFLVTISGPAAESAVVEVPQGLSVAELLRSVGHLAAPPEKAASTAVLAGGFFGGVLPVATDLVVSWDSFAQHGGGLGCASLYVIPDVDDVMPVAAQVATYYAHNTAGQCRTCLNATRDVAHHLTNEAPPTGHIKSLGGDAMEEITRWGTQLVGRGACAVPDGVALLLSSLLLHYPDQLAAHVELMAATRRTSALLPVRQAEWKSHTKAMAEAIPPVPVPVAAGADGLPSADPVQEFETMEVPS